MSSVCVDVHPVYGAIYQDGEFVQRGAVLGLSIDTTHVVVAPISGWIRLLRADKEGSVSPAPLSIEILSSRFENPASVS